MKEYNQYDVIIIGCGAAGMMAGITLADMGHKVVILEKNDKPGKKLFITGKGRCNLTNNCDEEQFFANVVTNPKFMYSAINNFNSRDTIDFFQTLGLKVKTERGGRVFPVSDHSSDVISVLITKLKRLHVDIRYNTEVCGILVEEGETGRCVKGITVKEGGINHDVFCENVVVATGGLGYPLTGSTGDGMKWARELGLTVSEPKPALVPLEVSGVNCRELMGLSLKNVEVSFRTNVKGKTKTVYKAFGEMLFTHFGVSGPVILSASSYLHKYDGEQMELFIDLKPALTEKQLDDRLIRDFTKNINKQFRNALDALLPGKLISVIVERSGIYPYKKVNEVTRQEREQLVACIKGFRLNVTGYRGFDEAIITQGGLSVKELNPKNMEVKAIKGLRYIGEVVDCDALTGGYNLQLAWSMARLLK
ncbi:MAG: NAD(P)/FAD-dependent oxidoreductase [Clostridium sp.]|nr:NAD(P)/FAD-dependent oxidoreductase [Clostridium sp.]MCM1400163.1 NAD(P)/FAD-dependent oxidoreductase [Clostridium sp.]MCM1460895.1 NAD(P)/FAD-dependent oxidoreductase [Bacteroides sp.]